MINITHLTSAHPRYDIRIFLKECVSLANAGHVVKLVVADGKGEEVIDSVAIYDVGRSSGRLNRILRAPRKLLRKAIELDSDVYHLHDPELIPIGLALYKLGKKVVFDSHEDVPKQLLGKPYLKGPTKLIVSKLFSLYERWACRRLTAVVAATSSIGIKFQTMGVKTVVVNNFPLVGELAYIQRDPAGPVHHLAYVGGIARLRGILEMVEAMRLATTAARLQLVGEFSDSLLRDEAHRNSGWSKVDELGPLDRKDVAEVLGRSIAGLVTFLPSPNHMDAQPNKMFEYMSAGLPVIASDFPLWRQIIEGSGCGICVDPIDPSAIAQAVDYLVDHPLEARRMGQNGKDAVDEKYNWRSEEVKLLNFYDTL